MRQLRSRWILFMLALGCRADSHVVGVQHDYPRQVATDTELRAQRESTFEELRAWMSQGNSSSDAALKSRLDRVQSSLGFADGSSVAVAPSTGASVEEPGSELLYIIDRQSSATFTSADIEARRVIVSTKLREIQWLGSLIGYISSNTAVAFAPDGAPPIAASFPASGSQPLSELTRTSPDLAGGKFQCGRQGGYMSAQTVHEVSYSWQYFSASFDRWLTQPQPSQCVAWPEQAVISGGPSGSVPAPYSVDISSTNCTVPNRRWSSSNPDVAVVVVTSRNTLLATFAEGEATITLTCDAQSLRPSSISISVVKNQDCDGGGGGYAELLAARRPAARWVNGIVNFEDGVVHPPSGGGCPGGGGEAPSTPPPPPPPDEHCHWVRDVVIFADGSYLWLSEWYVVCGQEHAARSEGPADGSRPFTVKLRTGGLPIGQAVRVTRTAGTVGGVEILLDVRSASAHELEAALVSAAAVLEWRTAAKGPVSVGRAIASRPIKVSQVGGSARAEALFGALRAASLRGTRNSSLTVRVIGEEYIITESDPHRPGTR